MHVFSRETLTCRELLIPSWGRCSRPLPTTNLPVLVEITMLWALRTRRCPLSYAAFVSGCPKALEVATLCRLLFHLFCELSFHTGLGNKARTATWWNGSKSLFSLLFLPLKSKMMLWRKGECARKLLVMLKPEFWKLIA